MKFTQPCFVRVENPQERKELDMWLRDIGYVVDRKFGSFFLSKHQTVQHGYEIEYDPADGVIDCGTNIPLFKALAAMNEDLVRPQWIYDHIRNELHYNHGGYPTRRYRMPTVEEIVSYFKTKKI